MFSLNFAVHLMLIRTTERSTSPLRTNLLDWGFFQNIQQKYIFPQNRPCVLFTEEGSTETLEY